MCVFYLKSSQSRVGSEVSTRSSRMCPRVTKAKKEVVVLRRAEPEQSEMTL